MGDHAWGLMQTAPNSMRPSSVGTSKIRRDDPGLQTVAGGQYSYRPRTPTRPSNSSVASPNLHLRKTCAMAARSPRSYIVKTRRASVLGNPHESQNIDAAHVSKSPLIYNSQGLPQQPQQDLQTAGGSRIPVEHYINIMRDSVHRIGQTADQIIDQLCFTSRRAQLDALFRLCPSIDFVEAGKVLAYLKSHASEIGHLRTLSKGHSVIPADHLLEPTQKMESHVERKNKIRDKTALPATMGGPGQPVLQGTKGVNAAVSGPNAKPMSARYRQEEAHARTHAPVLKYGIQFRNKNKSDVQTIFEDLDKQNTKVVVVGRHSARPSYMDCKPDWSLISRSSPMNHADEDRFKTLANSSLPSHMRPTFKYMHPAQIGQTNNYTKLRNFKKFHTDIQRTMMDSNKAKQNGRNAIHKPEVQYLNGSRRSNRTFNTSQRSFRG